VLINDQGSRRCLECPLEAVSLVYALQNSIFIPLKGSEHLGGKWLLLDYFDLSDQGDHLTQVGLQY
jgi:hypothetical protein